jgi:hypothetical protein
MLIISIYYISTLLQADKPPLYCNGISTPLLERLSTIPPKTENSYVSFKDFTEVLLLLLLFVCEKNVPE